MIGAAKKSGLTGQALEAVVALVREAIAACCVERPGLGVQATASGAPRRPHLEKTGPDKDRGGFV